MSRSRIAVIAAGLVDVGLGVALWLTGHTDAAISVALAGSTYFIAEAVREGVQRRRPSA